MKEKKEIPELVRLGEKDFTLAADVRKDMEDLARGMPRQYVPGEIVDLPKPRLTVGTVLGWIGVVAVFAAMILVVIWAYFRGANMEIAEEFSSYHYSWQSVIEERFEYVDAEMAGLEADVGQLRRDVDKLEREIRKYIISDVTIPEEVK